MVFGLFSKDRALKRAIAKATHKRARSEDRWAAMERLREIGTEEALLGLCRRFSFNYDKTIEDQQEKDWVVQTLAAKGTATLAPLRHYMKSARTLGYALVVLGRIGDPDTILEVIDEILADEEPGYTSDPKRRIDLIEWLGEWEGAEPAEASRRIAPYLQDFDENVRFKSVEALAHRFSPDSAAPLIEALLREEEESKRIKQRIVEVLAEHKAETGERKKEVSALLEAEFPDYRLHRDRLVPRKG